MRSLPLATVLILAAILAAGCGSIPFLSSGTPAPRPRGAAAAGASGASADAPANSLANARWVRPTGQEPAHRFTEASARINPRMDAAFAQAESLARAIESPARLSGVAIQFSTDSAAATVPLAATDVIASFDYFMEGTDRTVDISRAISEDTVAWHIAERDATPVERAGMGVPRWRSCPTDAAISALAATLPRGARYDVLMVSRDIPMAPNELTWVVTLAFDGNNRSIVAGLRGCGAEAEYTILQAN